MTKTRHGLVPVGFAKWDRTSAVEKTKSTMSGIVYSTKHTHTHTQRLVLVKFPSLSANRAINVGGIVMASLSSNHSET